VYQAATFNVNSQGAMSEVQHQAEAREQHRRIEEARPLMARSEAVPSCLTETETGAWIKRISSHLRLADALRP
jgi:hypothetical protein